MKVIVAAPYAIMNATFETDLEIIQNHLDAGDDVTLLGCNASLPYCLPNATHDLALCIRCVSRRNAGVRALSRRIDVKPIVHLRPEDRDELARLPQSFSSAEELCAVAIEGFDLGWGVLSSIISTTLEPHPDFAIEANADLARRAIIAAAAVYRSVQHHIDELKPDRVYVFNGRFAETRAVFKAARSRNVDCYLQDRGSTFRHYGVLKNCMLHDRLRYQELVREFWSRGDPEERSIMGASFFIELARGDSRNGESFLADQRQGSMPEGFDPTKNNVAVFTSSDFEFAAVGESWKNPVYRDQYDGLTQITASARTDTDTRLWIRMHPNARHMNEAVVNRTLALATPNAVVIAPTSPVSTYALMRASTRVLTFGSTTGIEAVYWGRPSILGSLSFYDQLGATYNPASHAELMALLRQPGLEPKDKEAALIYGYYGRLNGTSFRHYQPRGIAGDGPFRSVMVRPTPVARLAARALQSISGRAGKIHLGVLSRTLEGKA